jgi:intraflagellar transport protein 74
LQATERSIADVDTRIKQAEEELKALEQGRGSDSQEDVSKYQKLQEKDQEMTAFIASFPAALQAEQTAVKDTEERILAALAQLSKELQRQKQLPSRETFKELQAEVDYKQRGLENSQTTAERLQQEQEMRDLELQKINNLDQKITVELESLGARSIEYREALKTYNNVGQLKQQAEEIRTRMQQRKQKLDLRRKALKQQVQALNAVYEKEKQALAASESAGTLEALEQKLRHYEQNIFHLREFIVSKEAETDYTGVYEEVSTQVASINTLLQQMQQRIF